MRTKSYSSSSLRVSLILESFLQDETELTASEISRKTGLSKSTIHYILISLTESGLLIKNAESGKYSIGHKLFAIGNIYLKGFNFLKMAEPVVKTLNEITKEGVSIGILRDENMFRIFRQESLHSVRYVMPIGESRPAYASAMGKALLSEMTETQINNMFPKEKLRQVSSKTINTKAKLKLDLNKIRRTGISIDEEGGHLGVVGIARAIRNSNGEAIAAMTISSPVYRMNELKRRQLVKLIKMGTSLISHKLGYDDVAEPVRDIEEIYQWCKENDCDKTFHLNNE